MCAWVLSKELNQPTPREVRSHWIFKFTLVFLNITFLGLALLVLLLTYDGAHKMEILKNRGVITEGVLVGTSVEHGKPPRIYYYADYRFKPQGHTESAAYINEVREPISSDIYQRLRRNGQTVPVIYDPLNFARASLNFEDRVRTSDPFAYMRSVLEVVLPMIFLLHATIMAFLLLPYKKEKNLIKWGVAVSAMIIDEKEYYVGRVGRQMAVTYQFMDAGGKTITGVRKNLPRKNDRREDFNKFLAKAIDNPTVLYDPQNSENNMLYPPNFVVCSNGAEKG